MALKFEVLRCLLELDARGCAASTLVSGIRRADRPALATRRAVHVMNTIAVGRGQSMLVVLTQVYSGDPFIDRAQVARMRSCVLRGLRMAAQVAGDRIIGLGREMHAHRQRRDPREKELQDQRACHLADAKPGMPKLGNSPIFRQLLILLR